MAKLVVMAVMVVVGAAVAGMVAMGVVGAWVAVKEAMVAEGRRCSRLHTMAADLLSLPGTQSSPTRWCSSHFAPASNLHR